jgi:hypothetical protein
MTETMKQNEKSQTINDEKAMVDMSTKELLKLAFTEPKLEEPIGVCGKKCEGNCEDCVEANKELEKYYREDRMTEAEMTIWNCATCNAVLSYWKDDLGIHYFCNACFDDRDDYEDTGLDWNESGYFD